jgi:hypothetical protein
MITNSHGEDYRILGKVAKSDDFFQSGRVRIVAKMSTGLMSYYMKLCRQILSGQVDDVSKSWKVQPWHVQFYRNFVPTFRVSLCFIVARFMNFPISQGDAFLPSYSNVHRTCVYCFTPLVLATKYHNTYYKMNNNTNIAIKQIRIVNDID